MAYVIAVCGSGGKTTLCKEIAARYANENKKVCITTTTNMWFDDDVRNNFFDVARYVVGDDILSSQVGANACGARRGEHCEPGTVYYAGNVDEIKKKLKPLSEEDYKKLCDIFDYVIIEADGSRAMPMKIPNAGEPIIPDNVNEIVIVVGMESVGRKIGYICHRFNEFYGKDKFLSDNKIEANTIVSEMLIDSFVNHYYYDPLRYNFPSAKIFIYKNDYSKLDAGTKLDGPFKICLALCASGFSKRFGNENKLLTKISAPITFDSDKTKEEIRREKENTKLYQVMLNIVLSAKKIVKNRFEREISKKDLQIDVAIVSQYDEILNDPDYQNEVKFIKNENASAGLSSSIKLIVEKYKDYDAIVFINSDMPNLSTKEFSNFVFNSILNNNKMAAMFTDMPKNPAYFEKEYFDEILKIEGDKGPRELLDNNIKDLYRYYIDPNQLFEIDTKEDLYKLKNF
jgi:probable selenium-dependent hydroxylase accessory protein YqeC